MRRTDQRRAATFISYQRDVTGAPIAELEERGAFAVASENGVEHDLPVRLTPFARELAEGVEAEREELDRLIAEHAVDWDLDRIAPLERAILRVALYEILYRPDVPDEVAIDEAVETAKLYCGSDAPRFVNGILGGVMKQLARNEEGPR
jgi:transcription antitermination protein NusB